DLSEMLSLLLRRVGHDVEIARDGVTALAAAVERRPDVILLDIGLPGLDGYEVARQIRQQPATATVGLIAISGYGQDEDFQRATQAGFDDFLLKPIRLELLTQKLEPFLRSPHDGGSRRSS